MLKLEEPIDPHIIKISFTSLDSLGGFGPFFDILRGYSEETGLEVKTVDDFFNYKFTEDGFKIQFYWDNLASVYVFYIASSQYELIYNRLKKICADINRRIADKLYFEKHGELPNNGEGFK